MQGVLVFFSIIGILIGTVLPLILWYLLNKQFYNSACDKGYEERRYFWISFLGGVIGWLLIISLPDRGSATTPADIVQALNRHHADQGYTREENDTFITEERPLSPNEWRCSVCGRINQDYVGTCACGQRK